LGIFIEKLNLNLKKYPAHAANASMGMSFGCIWFLA